MANQEQVQMLLREREAWNTEWRTKSFKITDPSGPDLRGADLSGIDLRGAYLRGADLRGANLRGASLCESELVKADLSEANLSRADLRDAYLSETNLSDADLSEADLSSAMLLGASLSRANLLWVDLTQARLSGANLSGARLMNARLMLADFLEADLSGADLSGAQLTDAHLRDADLRGANLSGADLSGVDLSRVNLSEADLSRATIKNTFFVDIDLRLVKGLASVRHEGPSHLSASTLERSGDALPEIFLRGVGLSDPLIAYVQALAIQPIRYAPCFLGYSREDQEFVERLHADLQRRGIRCWSALEDWTEGNLLRFRESLRAYDKFVLVLSRHAVESRTGHPWVRLEAEAILEKEVQRKREALFLVRLDDTILTTEQAWARDLRRQRRIGDFTYWKEHDHYQKALQCLLHDLQAEERLADGQEEMK